MKKLISVSAAVLLTAIAIAQDTIPKMGKENIPGSNMTDTMPKGSWKKDTALLNRVNKWPDSSMHRSIPDSSLGHPNAGSQGDSSTVGMSSAADRVIMKDNQVMVVKNGDSTVLNDSIKLESGAIVMKDGSVTYTSGKTVQLKNGQYVSLNPTDNTSQADSSSTGITKAGGSKAAINPLSTATKTTTTETMSTTKTVVEDKVVMKDNKVIVIQKGDSTLLKDSIRLKSGAVVRSDASVRFKDGTTTKLKDGQFIALNPPAAVTKKSSKTTTKKVTTKKEE